MEITPELIYWITRLDGIKIFFTAVSAFSFLTGFISFVTFQDVGIRAVFVCISVSVFSAFACVLIPTTKEMAAIYIIPAVANNEKVQEMPDKVLTLADEWLEELRPKKEGK